MARTKHTVSLCPQAHVTKLERVTYTNSITDLPSLVPLFDVGLGPDLDFDEVVGRL